MTDGKEPAANMATILPRNTTWYMEAWGSVKMQITPGKRAEDRYVIRL